MVKKKDGLSALLKKYNQGIKLDIACGANKTGPDWIGIDIQSFPGVDVVHDIETYPWPLPDNIASVATASHVVEHINPAHFGFIKFMDEVWRIMKIGGTFAIATPYAGSPGYWQDPTHVNPCSEATWFYFDPLHESGLYRFYHPKPWKIRANVWSANGNLEVVLEKRRIDLSYAKK